MRRPRMTMVLPSLEGEPVVKINYIEVRGGVWRADRPHAEDFALNGLPARVAHWG
jgi:hypothetical protein